ncbi:MAG: Glutamyl-tRNA(Gln) amidotransferase subunit A, partial [Alphaproteobacteria bacterium MarineAlpha4_Bin2]
NGVRGMRIAIAEGAFWDNVDPEVASAVRATGDVFSTLGAHVESLEFMEAEEVLAANPRLLISSVEGFLAHERILGPEYDDYDDTLRFRLTEGATATAATYLRARSACELLSARTLETLSEVDVFLAPTTANPALPVIEVDASSESYQHWNGAYSRNTLVGNLLGLCAVTVPCGFNDRGLPIGLMVHAKPRCEAVALRVAYSYEQATDWHRRAPDLDWAI